MPGIILCAEDTEINKIRTFSEEISQKGVMMMLGCGGSQ